MTQKNRMINENDIIIVSGLFALPVLDDMTSVKTRAVFQKRYLSKAYANIRESKFSFSSAYYTANSLVIAHKINNIPKIESHVDSIEKIYEGLTNLDKISLDKINDKQQRADYEKYSSGLKDYFYNDQVQKHLEDIKETIITATSFYVTNIILENEKVKGINGILPSEETMKLLENEISMNVYKKTAPLVTIIGEKIKDFKTSINKANILAIKMIGKISRNVLEKTERIKKDIFFFSKEQERFIEKTCKTNNGKVNFSFEDGDVILQ